MLKQVQPVLASRNVELAAQFYVQKLGFSLTLLVPQHPAYAVLQRDGVEIYLQWHNRAELGTGDKPMLRFLVSEIEDLFAEFST